MAKEKPRIGVQFKFNYRVPRQQPNRLEHDMVFLSAETPEELAQLVYAFDHEFRTDFSKRLRGGDAG